MGTRADQTRFWQALDDRHINVPSTFMAAGWQQRGRDSARTPALPRNQPEIAKLAAQKPQLASRSAEQACKHWKNCGFLTILGLMESWRFRRIFGV
jgi:hypothetical protein